MLILSHHLAYVNTLCYYTCIMVELKQIGLELNPTTLYHNDTRVLIPGNQIVGFDPSPDSEHFIRLPREMADRLATLALMSTSDTDDCYGFARIVTQGRAPVSLTDRTPDSFARRYHQTPHPVDEIPSLMPGTALFFYELGGNPASQHVAISLGNDTLLQRFGPGSWPAITTIDDTMRFYGNNRAEILTPRFLPPRQHVARTLRRIIRRVTGNP